MPSVRLMTNNPRKVADLTQHSIVVTVGYGPRFLHSTGQLHKGDAGRGLFIQLTADDAASLTGDAPIPDEAGAPESSIAFGVLKAAQALGDRQALLEAGRHVISFHLGDDVVGGWKPSKRWSACRDQKSPKHWCSGSIWRRKRRCGWTSLG